MSTPSGIPENLKPLMEEREPPCLSVYLPTHRTHPENQQDPIRYKNLMTALEESLLREYDSGQSKALLESFHGLAEDADFWSHTWDGLAVFGAADLFQVFKLQQSVPALAIVARSFHLKPLLRAQQYNDRYQILSLNRRDIKLFEGSRTQLDEIDLASDVPATISEALGSELTEPHQTVASYGGTGLGSAMRHSHGSKRDEVEVDEERYFRAVDRAIFEHYSRPSGMPLMLAALPEYHALFHRVSHNTHLMKDGIEIDPTSLSLDQLRERAWSVVEPEFDARLQKRIDEYEHAKANGLGLDVLAKVATAAAQSRVGSLMVAADKRVPGKIAADTGELALSKLENPEVDDVLDDLAELVLQRGGEVVVIPEDKMPSTTGAAATLRF